MKPTKPAVNAYRKKIVQKEGVDGLRKNTRHGETLVPIGDTDAQVVLPKAEATHTYDILKTESMNSNLKVSCGGSGFLTGLLFSNKEGVLSIDPISNDTRTLTLNPSLSDGSWIEMLSEGNDWFCWGWTTGEDLSTFQSTVYIPQVPNENDKDADGLSDEQEIILGLDPKNDDSDNDGVKDGEEVALGTDPNDETDTPDLNQNSDGDPATDGQETNVGTDPLDGASYPDGEESTLPEPSEIGPVFTGIPNNLIIEAGTPLLDAEVTALIGVVANDNIDGNVPVGITFAGYTGAHGETFTATYSATDSDANTTQVVKTFNVEDTIAPVITLVGDNPLTVTSGSVGADPGITVVDASTFTTSSTWDSTITDETVAGTYNVVYGATDVALNAATPVTRSVVVEEVSSTEWIEEVATNGAGSNNSLVDNVLQTTTDSGGYLLSKTSYFDLRNYLTANETTATYSIWFRKTGDTYFNGSIDNTKFSVFSHQTDHNGLGIRIIADTGVQIGGEIAGGPPFLAGPYIGYLSSNVDNGNWHHVILSVSLNGSGNTQVQAVVDGVAGNLLTRNAAYVLGTGDVNFNTLIGAETKPSFSEGSFDAFEIVAGTTLTIPQMQALYNAGQGNMTIQAASEIVGTFPAFSGIQENLEIEEGTPLVDVETALLDGVTASDVEDGAISLDASNLTVNTYSDTMVDGNTFDVTYSVTDTDGNTTTVNKTYNIVSAGVISVGLVVDDDLFFSAEQSSTRLGTSTTPVVNPSDDRIYSFDGGASFHYYNGYRYDPHDFSAEPFAGNYEYSGNARTYSIWFNSDDMSATTNVIMSKFGRYGASGTQRGWSIHTDNGLIKVFVDNSPNAGVQGATVSYGDTGSGEDAILSSTWYHLAVTFNNGTAKIYINGVLKKQGATDATTVTGLDIDGDSTLYTLTKRMLTIAGRAGTNNGALEPGSTWVGSLGYPEIYYSELSPAQIQGIYGSQVAAVTAV